MGYESFLSKSDWYVDIVRLNADYLIVGTIWVFINRSYFSGFFYIKNKILLEKGHDYEE